MRDMSRLSPAAAVLVSALAACATGGSPQTGDDVDDPDAADIPGDPDARDIDAPPPIDAMPVPVTLTQSTSNTITAGNSLVCATGDPVQFTVENQFYRSFRLVDHGVPGQLTVTRVDIGIEEADTVAGQQTLTLTLYTAAGMFPGGALTQLHSQPVVVPDQSLTILPVTLSSPVIVPAGAELVVEVESPEHTVAGNFFFPGSNALGESRDSYIMAAGCKITTPVTYATVDGAAMVHLVMSVSGTAP